MKFVHADLWRNPGFPGVIAVTTNSIVKRDGGLVMGRGSAGEAAQRIPGIQHEIVSAVEQLHPRFKFDGRSDYGFVVVRQPTASKIGFAALQAKRDWRDVSDLETITLSIRMLREYLLAHPDVNVRTVFPGGGCGQIGEGTPPSVDVIAALLRPLPDNLTVCIRGTDRELNAL